MLGLEFGCGDRPRKKHFLGVDVRNLPNVAYVCNAWEIEKHVDPNIVDEIYSRHFLEHLTFKQADRTLSAWRNVLKVNGTITIIVPDMLFHIKQWLNPSRKITIDQKNGFSDENWAFAGFWGHQNGEEGEYWDFHKSGYDFDLLYGTLQNHGFTNITRINDTPNNLHVQATK